MNQKIKLLCRGCALREVEKRPSGYCYIDYENEHCGYCDECNCNTGHLLVVEILGKKEKIQR